jgi:plastocyanin
VRSLIAVLSIAVLALAPGIASARAGRSSDLSATTATAVSVQAKNFSFVLSRTTVPHGTITFMITNLGPTSHDFSIAGHTSALVAPHRSTRLTVTLTKPGSYPYRCTVDDHAALGMKGVLRVT